MPRRILWPYRLSFLLCFAFSYIFGLWDLYWFQNLVLFPLYIPSLFTVNWLSLKMCLKLLKIPVLLFYEFSSTLQANNNWNFFSSIVCSLSDIMMGTFFFPHSLPEQASLMWGSFKANENILFHYALFIFCVFISNTCFVHPQKYIVSITVKKSSWDININQEYNHKCSKVYRWHIISHFEDNLNRKLPSTNY